LIFNSYTEPAKAYATVPDNTTSLVALSGDFTLSRPSDEIMEDAYSKLLTTKAQTIVGTWGGQCVIGVRNFLGVGRDQVQGLAKNTQINSQEWEVGSVIVFRHMSWAGHVAIALFADANNQLWYADTNGNSRETWAIRHIALNDPRISGYRQF
jgi:hypothetical protein